MVHLIHHKTVRWFTKIEKSIKFFRTSFLPTLQGCLVETIVKYLRFILYYNRGIIQISGVHLIEGKSCSYVVMMMMKINTHTTFIFIRHRRNWQDLWVSITAGTRIAGAAVLVIVIVRQIYTITPKHIGLHIIPLHTAKQPFLYFVSLPLKKKSVFTDWGFLS